MKIFVHFSQFLFIEQEQLNYHPHKVILNKQTTVNLYCCVHDVQLFYTFVLEVGVVKNTFKNNR